METNEIRLLIGTILICLVLTGLLAWVMWGVMTKAQKFFELADELENLIRTEDSKDGQLKCLYELKKMSFHRNTGNRLTELAKMMELKYNIEILRK